MSFRKSSRIIRQVCPEDCQSLQAIPRENERFSSRSAAERWRRSSRYSTSWHHCQMYAQYRECRLVKESYTEWRFVHTARTASLCMRTDAWIWDRHILKAGLWHGVLPGTPPLFVPDRDGNFSSSRRLLKKLILYILSLGSVSIDNVFSSFIFGLNFRSVWTLTVGLPCRDFISLITSKLTNCVSS